MKRTQIVSALMLVIVLGAFGGVYQFYFKEKLELYARDQAFRDELQRAYADLNTTFGGYTPEVLTGAWTSEIIPWNNAIDARQDYYTVGDWYDAEKHPENGPILKFWYEEEARKMLGEIYQKVLDKMGNYNNFPFDLMGMLGIPQAATLPSAQIIDKNVNIALSELSFGISACELLLDGNASRIETVSVWPTRWKEDQYERLLKIQTVGATFYMTMQNLVKLIDSLRTADRFFSVDALKIGYPYVGYNQEPQLQVSMLFSQVIFRDPRRFDNPTAGTATTGATPGASTPGAATTVASFQSAQQLFQSEGLVAGRPGQKQAELGIFGKMWKWFKRYILYTY